MFEEKEQERKERKVEKYKSQENNIDCGPVAIYNALVWLGRNPTKKRLKHIKTRLRCSPTKIKGTNPDYLDWSIYDNDINLGKVIGSPTLSKINTCLNRNSSLIILIRHKRGGGHYMFIPSKTKFGYHIVNRNYRRYATKSWITRNKLLGLLQICQSKPWESCDSCMWEILKDH